jgi:hypothetical protein
LFHEPVLEHNFNQVSVEEKGEGRSMQGDREVSFWSGIPLDITKNNPFWQPMCDAIAVVGLGYKSVMFEELQGPILQAEKKDINSRLTEFKQSWEISGCTMMSDGWTNRKGKTLLNFLVHCPRGTCLSNRWMHQHM